MPIIDFPPIESADDESGLLAIGGDFELESLLLAYSKGIFPWPISEELPIAWFAPCPRGVIEFDQLRIPKSFKKWINKSHYSLKFNQKFRKVIESCQTVKRVDQDDTWITNELMEAYINFHEKGFAYSVEIYNQENTLVAGLYGVILKNYVTGESMFHLETNTSKLALIALSKILFKNNIKWLDTQMVTPVVESLGGREIARNDFLKKIEGKNSLRPNPLFKQISEYSLNPEELRELILT